MNRSSASPISVGIVIPAMNRATQLMTAIESVRSQSFEDWELLIVDDGSTDNTVALVKEVARAEPRLRLISHETTRGAQAARNTGIRATLAAWIAFLDSDDEWLPESLSTRLETARKTDAEVVYSNCLSKYSDGIRPECEVSDVSNKPYQNLLRTPGPMFQGMLVRREAILAIGLLDESIVSYQEWDTSIRLARHCSFAYVSRPLFIYNRMTEDSISSDLARDADGYLQIVKKHLMAIILRAGPTSAAAHFRYAAARYERAELFAQARRCLVAAAACWPLHTRGIVRDFRHARTYPSHESTGP